jgi:hypothetical protein
MSNKMFSVLWTVAVDIPGALCLSLPPLEIPHPLVGPGVLDKRPGKSLVDVDVMRVFCFFGGEF